ncbi:hypothetical protein LSAT2_004357 [Lamellibrachia satsuma]|nr:hypothetical protein LSAT2_004357 [Lamellibrachia satsuma]
MATTLWLLLCASMVLVYARKPTSDEVLQTLGRQLILQQLFVEERIRSEGDSGIKQIRHRTQGTRPYFSETHTGHTVASIHNHAHYQRTIGQGEFVAVLNGVEFRTRHNDYMLKMPHRTSRQYHLTEDVPFPDVPPEVLRKRTIRGQTREMQKWFKAWRDQDCSRRDYRKYFKPVLCYMEGAWIHTGEAIEDAFKSERHHMDAQTWYEMEEKIRYTSATGTKSRRENYSFLPRKILYMNGAIPVFVQWHYRIMCNPLKRDIPTSLFRPVCERANRLALNKKINAVNNPSTHFQLNPYDTPMWPRKEGVVRYQLLDKLMAEIPGKDNYPGDLVDNSFGLPALKFEPGNKPGRRRLNAAYYHRLYSETEKDAMRRYYKFRGFSDENIFMAMTSNPKVAEFTVQTNCTGTGRNMRCDKSTQRWSYSIPMEIIYTTPLSSWNPYRIKYKGHEKSKLGKTVEANGRNGGFTPAKAYDGANNKWSSFTPPDFYSGKEPKADLADTTVDLLGVLTPTGRVVKTRISGHRVILPRIRGVGALRQRWPIMPIYSDGNPVMKELQALIDIHNKCI